MTSDEKRAVLRACGWKRTDRTSQGKHCELWLKPFGQKGPELRSLNAAYLATMRARTIRELDHVVEL